jgi:hypothetical protein
MKVDRTHSCHIFSWSFRWSSTTVCLYLLNSASSISTSLARILTQLALRRPSRKLVSYSDCITTRQPMKEHDLRTPERICEDIR